MGENTIDSRVRTRLAERRQAQEALDNDEVFEALTCEALLTVGGLNEDQLRPVAVAGRWRRWVPAAIAAGLAVAAYLVFWPSADTRIARGPKEAPAVTEAPSPAKPSPGLRPTLDRPSSDQPVLLASRIVPPGRAADSEIFRGGADAARAPRREGRIEAVDGESVVVNLGSEDGLRKGSELSVLDEAGRTRHRLLVSAVFRGRARATAEEDGIARVSQTVRTGSETYLTGVLQYLDALIATGSMNEARRFGQSASTWAESQSVPSSQRARVSLRLGLAEFHSGSPGTALRHLEEASGMGRTAPPSELTTALETLAAVQIAKGDPGSAERTLGRLSARVPATEVLNNLAAAYLTAGDSVRAAQTLERIRQSADTGPVVTGQVLNNRGVLEELRGNQDAARQLYLEARSLFERSRAAATDRQAVESNLARLDKR